MSLGDVPTWVAAVAAWAGVVVNALIVFVALSPIRTAKREREARGRLVAAYLAAPMTLARVALKGGRNAITVLLKDDANEMEREAALKQLGELPENIQRLLDRFDVSEAAYLGEGMGEKLAQSFGAVNVALMCVPVAIDAFTTLHKLKNLESSQRVENLRERTRNVVADMPETFDNARARLKVFTDYCVGLGFLGKAPDE